MGMNGGRYDLRFYEGYAGQERCRRSFAALRMTTLRFALLRGG